MTTIETMRKALEALEHAEKDAADFQRINTDQTGAAITALRTELERLEGVEPVAFVDRAELKNMSADFEPTISKAPVSELVRAAVAAERERLDDLLRRYQGISLETLECLEGPSAQEWAELDSDAAMRPNAVSGDSPAA